MRIIMLLFALLVIITGVMAFFGRDFVNDLFSPNNTPTATINNKTFKLYIAKSSREQQIGLSDKKSLPQNYGMLFPFGQDGTYSFWMKDMKFPIDIIFINNNKIVTIHQDVQSPKSDNQSPPVYQPTDPADTVLEINAGLSKKNNFKKGDTVEIKNFKQ